MNKLIYLYAYIYLSFSSLHNHVYQSTEYLLSVDIAEASRCIKELNSPFFFHEIIKRAVTASLDQTEEKQIQISKLFKYLYDIGILTNSNMQIKKGFDKLYLALPDLVLDTPDAKRIVDSFKQRAMDDQILSVSYVPPKAQSGPARLG
jgi:programmed cell death protein 4